LIVPADVPVNIPILTGEEKLPVPSDNCAVKIFPLVNVPPKVKGTLTASPAQNVLFAKGEVVTEGGITGTQTIEILEKWLSVGFVVVVEVPLVNGK
jgi:hypothetical protein